MAQKKKAQKKSGRAKTAKKSRKPAAKKAGSKRAGRKAPAARKTARAKKTAGGGGGPRAIATGRGPGPLEVASQVVELLRAGRADEVEKDWLAADIESVEGVGVSQAWKGKKAVQGKYRAWEADHEIHEMAVEGPWVGATGFAVKYRLDATQKSTGQRHQMEEIAVYTIRDGKITREEFHFATGGPMA